MSRWTARDPRARPGRLVLRSSRLARLASAMTATGVLANALLLPVLPDLVDAFGQDEAGGGLLLGIGSAPGIVLSPVLGALSDRHGRRVVVIPCLVTFALGGLGLTVAGTWPLLLVSRFVQGLGAAGLVSLAIVLLGDSFEGAERASRLATNAAALTTSSAVAPLVSGVVGQHLGPQAPLAFSLVGLPIAWHAAHVLPRQAPERAGPSGGGRALVRHLRSDRLVLPLVTGAVLFLVYFGPTRVGATFAMAETFGASTAMRGGVLLAASAPSIAVSLFLANRAPGDPMRAVAVAFAVFTVGLLIMAGAPVLIIFVLGALLTGLGEGAIVPLLQSRISEAARPDQRGAVLATWASGVRVGQSGGPLLSGAVLRSAPPSVLFGGAAAVTLVLAVVASRSPTAMTGRNDAPGHAPDVRTTRSVTREV